MEFAFNFIKQKVYKKVFNSFKKLIHFINNILMDEDINETLITIFIKTMNFYNKFVKNFH